jgi:hypothetical protein
MNPSDIYTSPEIPDTQNNKQAFPEKSFEPSKQKFE